MKQEKEIKIINDLTEVPHLAQFVEEFCTTLGLPEETTMNINLAIEEAVANIIMYAYPTQERHEILLEAKSTEQKLIFLLTDTGISFDPTKVPDVDVMQPLETRPIGGLGVYLIRQIMNEVTYQRLDGENRLTMKKML